MDIRNIAIIAHVDHGKTTLTDSMMRQAGVADETFSMDTNDLEKERGITIYSKNASLTYKDHKINIVDTPGHADFGSEVERVLRAIDCVLLIVDAQEGPMPQTKFVLKKSLELGLKPIVVINKIDKPAARPKEVIDEVLDLFMDLGANDEQLNFTSIFAIGKQGIAKLKMEDESSDLTPLFETIIKLVPPAPDNSDAPLLIQPFNLAYDNYLGRMAISRIYQGKVKVGDNVLLKDNSGKNSKGKITKIFSFQGMKRVEVNEAFSGDITLLAGMPDVFIGDTICTTEDQIPLPSINVDEPTIALNFLVNSSPFAGREGKYVTNSQIKERLEKELEVNVGLKIDFSLPEYYRVFGRGELHIAILLENMRREGYEIQVSQPQVIIKHEDGKKLEPFEEVIVEVPDNMTGLVIEKLAKRKAVMQKMEPVHGHTRMVFEAPTRGLLGYRNQFIMDTSGEGILYTRVIGFKPHVGVIEKKVTGSMISMDTGKALAYALANLEMRGQLYIGANTEIYQGQVIGNTSKGEEMVVNALKGKHLTNMRSAGAEDAVQLTPHLELTLERGLEVMDEDEYLEITPESVRLRKQLLSETDRVRASRKNQ